MKKLIFDSGLDEVKNLSERGVNIQFGSRAPVFWQDLTGKQTTLSFYSRRPINNVLTDGQWVSYLNANISIPINTQETLEREDIPNAATYFVKSEINYEAKEYLDYINSLPREDEIISIYSENFLTKGQIQAFSNVVEELEVRRSAMTDAPARFVVFGKDFNYLIKNGDNSFPINNRITIYLNEDKNIVNLFATSLAPEIYQRLMVLIGHHKEAIGHTSLVYGFDSIVDNYDFSFNEGDYEVLLPEKPFLGSGLSYDAIHYHLLKNIRRTILANPMSYEDIFNNNANYNETLFFKIEKWLRGPEGPPIQTFFIPATGNFLDFVDTQIKQRQNYFYRVTSYSIIVGSKYFFSDLATLAAEGPAGEAVVACNVNAFSSIKISETVIFEETLRNVLPPPRPPYVSFHNKSDSSNKIKIYLALQKGEEQIDFRSIFNEID